MLSEVSQLGKGKYLLFYLWGSSDSLIQTERM